VGDDSCPFSRRARDGAPPSSARSPSAPARDVRVSHESAPNSGHDPSPKPKPLPLPNPSSRTPCRAGVAAAKIPARPYCPMPTITGSAPVCLWPPYPNQTNRRCEFMQPLPLPIPTSRSPYLAPAFSQSPAHSPSKTAEQRADGPPARCRCITSSTHSSVTSDPVWTAREALLARHCWRCRYSRYPSVNSGPKMRAKA
jgi:hypothetical protein